MIKLKKPIQFQIERCGPSRYESYYCELGIYGIGETQKEAEKDALDMFASLYHAYVDTDRKQSDVAIAFANRLKEYA
jgi:hypothetical protein